MVTTDSAACAATAVTVVALPGSLMVMLVSLGLSDAFSLAPLFMATAVTPAPATPPMSAPMASAARTPMLPLRFSGSGLTGAGPAAGAGPTAGAAPVACAGPAAGALLAAGGTGGTVGSCGVWGGEVGVVGVVGSGALGLLGSRRSGSVGVVSVIGFLSGGGVSFHQQPERCIRSRCE